MRYRRHAALILAMVFVVSLLTHADNGERSKPRGSTYVALDSWVYPVMDRMAALGYMPTQITGLRPWTRDECARLITEAGAKLTILPNEPVQQMYDELAAEFFSETKSAFSLDSVYVRSTGIAGTPLTDGYHFAQTIDNDFGRPYQEGANFVAGASVRANRGPFAFYARGEFQHSPSAPAQSWTVRMAISQADGTPVLPESPFAEVNRFRLLDSYVAVNTLGWQLSFGKQSLWWGPGAGGAVNFSDNAEPIPMLRISRTTPFRLPSILGKLGEIRMEIFWGRVDGHQFVRYEDASGYHMAVAPFDRHPYIDGEKISFKPTDNLEFGASATTMFSGPGIPLTLHTLLSSYSLGYTPPGSRNDPGDRRAGFDFRYRIPGLRNWLTIYNDSMADDSISPLEAPSNSALNPGIYLSHFPGLPKLDLRVEAANTDVLSTGFYYWNGKYRSGYTNNGSLMAGWVGRDGTGVKAQSTYWISPRNTLQVLYRQLHVGSDFLRGGEVKDIGIRTRFMLREELEVSAAAQYEHWYFPLLATGGQNNLTATLQITYRPGSWWGARGHRSQDLRWRKVPVEDPVFKNSTETNP